MSHLTCYFVREHVREDDALLARELLHAVLPSVQQTYLWRHGTPRKPAIGRRVALAPHYHFASRLAMNSLKTVGALH